MLACRKESNKRSKNVWESWSVKGDVTGLECEGRGRSAVPSAAVKLREEAEVAVTFGSGDFNEEASGNGIQSGWN